MIRYQLLSCGLVEQIPLQYSALGTLMLLMVKSVNRMGVMAKMSSNFKEVSQ